MDLSLIHILKTEASEYAINIWFTALNAAYNLGRYEILKYSEEIIETLKACQDNKAVYSQVNACYAFLGALFFNTGHVDTALSFYDLSDKCATQQDVYKRQSFSTHLADERYRGGDSAPSYTVGPTHRDRETSACLLWQH